jgi:glycosyltransferase involved in cell wall biosynthesis
MPADLSVVICSFNGSQGVDRCLHALAEQTRLPSLEIIVVDDGSTDDTSDVARAHGVTVIRHITNCGAAAARNSGARVALAPIVAFLDDDCEPEPSWAEHLLAGYEEQVVAVGGPLVVSGGTGIIGGFLRRHNPLDPQELDLNKSDRLPYRFVLYLRRQWAPAEHVGVRDVFSFATANMSVRLEAFLEIGGFDERFRFGSED